MLTEGNYVLTGTITEFNNACLKAFNECYKKGFRKGLFTGAVWASVGVGLVTVYNDWKDKKAKKETED